MLDVRKLRLLRELAHRGTIAAVAEALSYTPSAVSQQLTALERETGVPLLERTGRRVTLTPAAHGLVARTESILALLNAAAADLENASRALSGVLRIGAFPTAVRPLITPHWLPSAPSTPPSPSPSANSTPPPSPTPSAPKPSTWPSSSTTTTSPAPTIPPSKPTPYTPTPST